MREMSWSVEFNRVECEEDNHRRKENIAAEYRGPPEVRHYHVWMPA